MKDLVIGGRKFKSRFFLGTGKFASGEMLKRALAACGTELVTTALTRVHEGDAEHDDILGVIDRSKVEVMLNTSGARNAAEAVRIAKLGKAAGYNWIKIEVHPDARYLLPDPVETLEAVKECAKLGMVVLPYINADPVLARHCEDAGAAAVMPLGSPIGSNRGIRTRDMIEIIVEQSHVPVVVDAGIGLPSHAAEAIVSATTRATTLPVTVKIRAGWDEHSKNAVEFARRMEAAGADLITVHGRTRMQFYAPKSDNAIIAAVKAAVKVPVIGNGDLFTAEDVRHILQETGCDGVMIARGALGNPFLFAEILAMLNGQEYTPPTTAERVAMAIAHARDMVARKGERIGTAEARKHMAWYSKGLRGAAAVRDALMRAESLDEIATLLTTLIPKEEFAP